METVTAATLQQARHDSDLDEIATRRSLKELECQLESRIKDVDLKIAETQSELVRWVVGAGLLQTALIAGLLIKLIATFPG